jgi:hypothetical protein
MAGFKCTHCNKTLSYKAEACPNCGHPEPGVWRDDPPKPNRYVRESLTSQPPQPRGITGEGILAGFFISAGLVFAPFFGAIVGAHIAQETNHILVYSLALVGFAIWYGLQGRGAAQKFSEDPGSFAIGAAGAVALVAYVISRMWCSTC